MMRMGLKEVASRKSEVASRKSQAGRFSLINEAFISVNEALSLVRDFQIKKYSTIYCGVGDTSAHSQRRARCPPHKIGEFICWKSLNEAFILVNEAFIFVSEALSLILSTSIFATHEKN
jgi:hypothetical protein